MRRVSTIEDEFLAAFASLAPLGMAIHLNCCCKLMRHD